MGLEFELKFRAEAADLERIRAAWPGEYIRIPMSTTYYDTPGGDLSARHWTLRHRQEGENHVCTLKTPADGPGRGEWEWLCGDIHEAIPHLAELSGHTELLELTQKGLCAACGAGFTRLARMIDLGGTTVELALDQGELLNGQRVLPFAEVEVELKKGSQEDTLTFGSRLAQEFGLEPEPRSKFARAKMLGEEKEHGI